MKPERTAPSRARMGAVVAAVLLAVMACNVPVETRFWSTPAVKTPAARTPAAQTPGAQTPTRPSVAAVQPTGTQAGPTQPPAALPTPTPIADPSETPPPALAPSPDPRVSFEPAPCAFPVPAGYAPECGYLLVPENRARPASRLIRLHVALFHSDSPNPAPDPVIHLSGGPGSSSLGLARYLFSYGVGAVLQERDLVLFDQRGTGYSEPRLDCPERQALAAWLLSSGAGWDEQERAIVEAFERCRQRLESEGVDLAGYTSAQSAADVADLRRVLGAEQVNLYGVSYGTRLALTVMRDYPAIVRGAVLDSAYPPQANLYTALAPNAGRAFRVFFNRCALDAACAAAYPDLEITFYDLVDRLNAAPAPVAMNAGGQPVTVLLDGGLFIDVLFVGLYNPAVAETMPRMIEGVRRGEYAILRGRLSLYFDDSSALGMNMAVQCGEEIAFSTPEEAVEAARGAQPQIAAFFPNSIRPLFAACRAWAPGPPDPRENQPVRAEMPVLILAGEFDPITPPDWGRMAAETLPQASFYEFPGNGHWVTRSSPCAMQTALDFWRDPTGPVNGICP